MPYEYVDRDEIVKDIMNDLELLRDIHMYLDEE